MNKENFIKILSSLSSEDIRKLISDKGKEPKLIAPFIILDELEEDKNESRTANK